MPLDRMTKDLLRKALRIQNSEVPLYRVLDILATDEGDIDDVVSRYADIKNKPLRVSLHYCAELLRHMARTEGLLPAWEQEGPSTDDVPKNASSRTQDVKMNNAQLTAKKKKGVKEELKPFIDETMRNQVRVAKAYIDGASRGNPGMAAVGVALFTMDGKKIAQLAKPIGTTTNNIAEYTALTEALKLALDLGIEQLHVLGDSKLIVEQVNGKYKIKSPDLLAKAQEARSLIQRLKRFTLSYISRENNKLADALSNYALDFSDGSGNTSETTPLT